MERYERVWAEVDLDAINNNIKNLKSLTKEGTLLCAVIKADAYGHGAAEVEKAIENNVDFLATATTDEAINLRSNGAKLPILVLGYTDKSRVADAINNEVRLSVYDLETAKEIDAEAEKLNKKAKIHIKVDTGMNRIGIPADEKGVELAKEFSKLPNLEIEGIYTHFFKADDENDSVTFTQFERFNKICDELKKEGIEIQIKHCSNSAATTRVKDANCDMVRLGISMYGLYPSEYVHQLKLEPALSLKSHVTMVKTINAGESVGYGGKFVAEKPTKIATISIGYADGYNRRLSCKADVLINGKRAKLTGTVCMDQIMADVSDIDDVKTGDEVVLIGKQGQEEITLEELADIVGTINYELSCLITRRVPRYYLENGKVLRASHLVAYGEGF